MHPLTRNDRGVEQLVARQAHNLEVARSNPASATKKKKRNPNVDYVSFCFRNFFYFKCRITFS